MTTVVQLRAPTTWVLKTKLKEVFKTRGIPGLSFSPTRAEYVRTAPCLSYTFP